MSGLWTKTTLTKTQTEKRIIQQRSAKGVIVPLLEELLEQPVEIDDEEDIEFVGKLLRDRMVPREKNVFSPSSLGSCLRQAYFARTGQKKIKTFSPRTNSYFLDGNFRHIKWQFALWKLHRAGKLELLGVELRVYSPAGDFAGTIDALVKVNGVLYIVDFKGMNVRDFQKFYFDGVFVKHRIQIVGYASIASAEHALLIAENKSGPTDRGSPIGLHEENVQVKRHKSEMKKRLAELRRYVDEEEVPPPACVSTRHREYQECPFSPFCREEVRAIQQQREAANRSDPNKPKVARSRRASVDRPSRSRPRRKKNPS